MEGIFSSYCCNFRLGTDFKGTPNCWLAALASGANPSYLHKSSLKWTWVVCLTAEGALMTFSEVVLGAEEGEAKGTQVVCVDAAGETGEAEEEEEEEEEEEREGE
jgi:hypothetical protein